MYVPFAVLAATLGLPVAVASSSAASAIDSPSDLPRLPLPSRSVSRPPLPRVPLSRPALLRLRLLRLRLLRLRLLRLLLLRPRPLAAAPRTPRLAPPLLLSGFAGAICTV